MQTDPNAYASDETRNETDPAPMLPLFQQPSTWAGLWVLIALAWLTFARKSFGRLG